jgi:hypothetical protein
MKRNEIERRHSDQSNKGTCTNVLPLLGNKSEVATCEDHMPEKIVNQRKYDLLGKKLCKASERSLEREQEHCRSCPKLFHHEHSSSSSHLSSKLCFGECVREENITPENQRIDCGLSKSTVDNCKCQITEKHFDIPSQKLDIDHQIQSLTCNTQAHLSETKESLKDQFDVKKHTTENNMLIYGTSTDYSSTQCQDTSTVKIQNLDWNKHGSSKSNLDST